jgi:hypothetical protein
MDHPGVPRVWAFSCIREPAGHSPWMGFRHPQAQAGPIEGLAERLRLRVTRLSPLCGG